jgi:methyl-accepting chemotaxis protein
MNFLGNLSLKMKIMLGVVLASTLAVILASAIFVYVEKQRLHDDMYMDLRTIALVVAGNTTGALSFEDRDSATEALKSLRANPQIIGAVLYNAKGKVFAVYEKGADNDESTLPTGFSSTPSRTNINYTENHLEITEAVMDGDQQVGTITLRESMDQLNTILSEYSGIAVIITLVSAIFSALLSLAIQKAITRPIIQVANALRDIAEGEGDLTRRLRVSSRDEIGELAKSFNSFVEKVHGVTCEFRDTAGNLYSSAEQLSLTTEKTNQGVIRQQSEIDQIASAITQMSGTVQEVARNVAMAARDAEEADSQATQGKNTVEDTMQAIENLAGDIERAADVITRLQKESDNIGAVLEVIGGIAEQTNLLALNAAIEAARAGEQGRGFAVVADEVRTLARRTQSSTQEIQQMIDRLQAGAKEAVTVMEKGRQQASTSVSQAEKAGDSLKVITNAVSAIKDMTQQIASASEEQSSVTEEINQSILNISQVASQTADDSHHIADGSGELTSLATNLKSLISQFKL